MLNKFLWACCLATGFAFSSDALAQAKTVAVGSSGTPAKAANAAAEGTAAGVAKPQGATPAAANAAQAAPSAAVEPKGATAKPPSAASGAAEAPPAEAPPADGPPTPEVTEEARRRFDRGVRLYAEGDYSLALIEFERAYELVANYRVLYNIGQVSIQLRQYARARQALEQYLSQGQGEIDEVRLAEVQADVEMLKSRTAKLSVTVNVAKARVFLDGRMLGVTPLPDAILVDAGGHSIEVERTGFRSTTKAVTMAGGDDLKVTLSLELIQPERTVEKTIVVQGQESNSTWKWVGWGTAGLFAAGAVTTGIFGLNAAADLEDLRNSAGASREALDSTQSRARRMFVASDILAVGALAAAGVSLYLTFGGDGTPSESDPSQVKVGVGPGSLSLQGAF